MKKCENPTIGFRFALTVLMICGLLSAKQASAVERSSRPTELHHATWGAADGLPGPVVDVAQTKDGYLWVLTKGGPFRFDGLRFESLTDVCHCERDSSADVWIHAGASGALWVGGLFGISSVINGQITSYAVSPKCGLPYRMTEDRDKRLWVAGQFGLCSLTNLHTFSPVPTPGMPNGRSVDIFSDSNGTLWMRSMDSTLYFRRRGESTFHKNQSGSADVDISGSMFSIAETPDGRLWDSGYYGLRRIYQGAEDAHRHPSHFFAVHLNTHKYDRLKPSSLLGTKEMTGAILADHQGALWISVEQGLLKVSSPSSLAENSHGSEAKGTSLYTVADGLSSDVVWCLFEDREGNIWIGTNSGLDRLSAETFHRAPFPMKRQTQVAVGVQPEGGVLAGNWDTPLMQLNTLGIHKVPGLRDAQIQIIYESPKSGTWVVRGGEIWKKEGETFVSIAPPQKWLGSQPTSLATDEEGALWVSFTSHGIYRLAKGEWTDENPTFGIPEAVSAPAFASDADGTLWLAGGKTLSEYRKGQLYKHHMADKATPNYVMQIYGKHIWLGGLHQFAVVVDGKLHVIRGKNRELFQRVSGIVEVASGDVWFNSDKGAGFIKAAEVAHAVDDPTYEVSFRRFTATDGFDGYGDLTVIPNAVPGQTGRIWMSTNRGVFYVDPSDYLKQAASNPPPVVVERVKATSQSYLPLPGLRLPANSTDIEIQFTGLCLSFPERSEFRYRLSGVDSQWQFVGTRRQAYYNKLAPGRYKFSVTARNPEGDWNKNAAELDFEVAPSFYQTWWFETGVLFVFSFAIWLLVQTQIARSNAEIRGRLSARLQERERIARELHDTLLQGFHGLMLRFHAASEMLKTPEAAGAALNDALERADCLMVESRDKIRDLRYESEQIVPLPEALAAAGGHLTDDYALTFEAAVDGTARNLNPLIKEEVYLVGREALFNAFRHSGGSAVEMEITFHPAWLRLRIRDNGRGIPLETLRSGGAVGHWGISGMLERSDRIGAQFRIWNRPGSGCEVELQIPASIAYSKSTVRSSIARLRPKPSWLRMAFTRTTEESDF